MTSPLLVSNQKDSSCHDSAGGPAKLAGEIQIALVGNPNAGKTTLFNALTGIRAKTANFPGTTLEVRRGPVRIGDAMIDLVDLPGIYSLQSAEAEERIALDKILGRIPGHGGPKALVLLLDATNLVRNLFLASQVLELGLPTIAVLTMIDVADSRGMKINQTALGEALGCEVVAVTAKTGRGLDDLKKAISRVLTQAEAQAMIAGALPKSEAEADYLRFDWAEGVGRRCLVNPGRDLHGATEKIDRVLTHKVYGFATFLAVMLAVFLMIFYFAQWPMGWIETVLAGLGEWVGNLLPEGDLRSLLVNGVIGGVGGVLVFLPQICLIFFCLTLLEDVGYMARAALVMDRMMRRVGLPGKAFVPMLSAHACAIPAIMATRVIESRRDRLVTILIIPLLSCSARLPVYFMVTALLFGGRPLLAALTLLGAYLLGMAMAVTMAAVFQRTILPGKTDPLVIELPDFRMPSLKMALLTTYDRARMFVMRAGTTILALSVILWALATYPRLDEAAIPAVDQATIGQLRTEAEARRAAGDNEAADAAQTEADNLIGEHAMANSYSGMLGHAVEPVLRPLGFDWKIGIGVISSFAAREVIVSTLGILYGVGEDVENAALYDKMREAKHPDGRPVFTFAASLSLLVFFVLAMQCLPTQVVARRETGSWKWPLLQFGYMTALAYLASLIVYQTLSALGLG